MTAEETSPPPCPNCGGPWLGPTALTGRYRCAGCLHRFELRSVCQDCGEHGTISRMSTSMVMSCNHCGGSLLEES